MSKSFQEAELWAGKTLMVLTDNAEQTVSGAQQRNTAGGDAEEERGLSLGSSCRSQQKAPHQVF